MTKQDLAETKKEMVRNRKEVTKSPEAARAYLQKLGVLTKAGKLTKHYRPEASAA